MTAMPAGQEPVPSDRGGEPALGASDRELARKRLEARRGLTAHVVSYVVINVFLVVIWALVGGGFPWFIFPIMGWGIGLVAHGVVAFLLSNPEEIVLQREQKRLAQGQ